MGVEQTQRQIQVIPCTALHIQRRLTRVTSQSHSIRRALQHLCPVLHTSIWRCLKHFLPTAVNSLKMHALSQNHLRCRCQHAVHRQRRVQLVRVQAAAPGSAGAITAAEQPTGLPKQSLLYDGVSTIHTMLSSCSQCACCSLTVPVPSLPSPTPPWLPGNKAIASACSPCFGVCPAAAYHPDGMLVFITAFVGFRWCLTWTAP
jgi:hypothetical protein